jgi:hypothetical protein
MIENSIQQFRARRNASRSRAGAGAGETTKQRLGLAQRDIARSEDETSRALQRAGEAQEAQYNPADSVNSWAGEIEALRTERASREQSTTGALDMSPIDSSSGSRRPATRWEEGQGRPGGAGGRAGAEEFLGRPMSDVEWDGLLRTTYAESSMGSNEERAAVMSVVLNRVNSGRWGDTVTSVINARNQFQAVTGTPGDRNPSNNYKTFNNNGEDISTFETSVVPLLSNFTEQNWLNFTAANRDAYGEGTDVGFLDRLTSAQDSMLIGQTMFGTDS